MRRAIVALRRSRHDYATPLNALNLLAEEMRRRGMVNRHEVADTIQRLVREMDVLRVEASASRK